MQRRPPPPSGGGGSTNLILVLLSCLACVYVGGRLWQDAKIRQALLQLAQDRKTEKSSGLSTEDSMKILDYKEREKRLAVLEMEVASAKTKGYIPALTEHKGAAMVNGSTHTNYLAVIGINTGFGQKARRDSIRKTWMPTGKRLKQLEEQGVVLRFTVGRSANKGDMSDRLIDEENRETEDFLILEDHVEAYDELPKKTKKYFAAAVSTWKADFFVKVDDDVYLNVDRLVRLLTHHRDTAKLYLGCMKSGEVYSQPTQRWHEPEWWKFGDAKFYFRHATGQIYVLSRALALYVAANRNLLHEFRNEDVSLGSWMIGLDAIYVDERRLCCASPPEGDCAKMKSAEDGCIAVFDWKCSGLCHSVERMSSIHNDCG